METTILLAKVFGLYCIIGGLAVMLRQGYFIPIIGRFVEKRLIRLVVAMVELLGGLFLVVTHQVWDASFAAWLITLFGWLFVLEGAAYMFLPDSVVAWIIQAFNKRSWYTLGGLLAIVVGIYLAGFGFGWF